MNVAKSILEIQDEEAYSFQVLKPHPFQNMLMHPDTIREVKFVYLDPNWRSFTLEFTLSISIAIMELKVVTIKQTNSWSIPHGSPAGTTSNH